MLTIYNLFIFFCINIILVNTLYIREQKKISISEFYIIFIWHFVFSLIYLFYVTKFGGDTNGYLEAAKRYFERPVPGLYLGNGSATIYALVDFLYNDLKFDVLNIVSIFNFFGFVGLIYFFKTLKEITKKIESNNFINKNLPYLIIFIPSLSFWTCGIGKEPFVFMSISIFLYNINKKKCNYLVLLLCFLILFQVRWQFSLIMLSSALFVFKVKDTLKFLKDIKVLTLFIIAFISINLLTNYFYNFHIFKLDPIFNAIYKKQTFVEDGALVVNFNASFIQIILNYLFSPLRFESILFTIVSVENIYLILLILYLLINFNKNNFQNINLSLLCFIVLFLAIIPFATFNIGIALRQKWVVLVVIFVLLTSGQRKHEQK